MQDPQFLTIDQVATTLKVSKMTVYRYVKSKILPAYKLEQELRVKEDDLTMFLKQRKVNS